MEKKVLNNLIAFDFKMICNLEKEFYIFKIFVECKRCDINGLKYNQPYH